jgi:hypothetical protein
MTGAPMNDLESTRGSCRVSLRNSDGVETDDVWFCNYRDANAFVATHNAADVLIEIVRTEIEMSAAYKRVEKARLAWSRANSLGDPSQTPLFQALVDTERTYVAALDAHLVALAKVSP